MSCAPRTYTSIAISGEDTYGKIAHGIPKQDTLMVKMWANGDTASIGKYAITKDGYISKLKTGHWKEYSEGGQIKEEGEYKLGSMIDCCAGGACRTYYHYKIGPWKYYDEQGKLRYQVTYQPDTLQVDTRCQDGDRVAFGLIKDYSRLNYLYKLSLDTLYALQKVKIEDEIGKGVTILTPLNGQLFLEYKNK
jgi:hypothetical protein